MYLAGYTMQEIAEAVGIEKMSVSREVESCNNFTTLEKSYKIKANFQDSDIAFTTIPFIAVVIHASNLNCIIDYTIQIIRITISVVLK